MKCADSMRKGVHPLVPLLLPSLCSCVFFPGRVLYAENEYPELSGRMTPRAAVAKCEIDSECAGFTFLGTRDLDQPKNVAFFRYKALTVLLRK